eukprot:CAMPEP_0168533920 /NCGR_PEP_ID=MMETSP0405-20121227/17475_1 /TAXON_ID=498012 /ORGANISM="Trichosphaerium sp, Strain Am-I-7 wt" /LENGTH=189 /DNA_ID=CAMNT_0008560295 /DNA_START=17 /DNA_END=582 /DNA_ORIENTATION=-
MVRTIKSEQKVTVDPDSGVEVTVKARHVTVKGPRGTLNRHFKRQLMDIKQKDANTILVSKYFGSKKENAAVGSVVGHIQNMITGVTKGFRYKLRCVYAHFPINTSILDDGKVLEIRNFLGEKAVRRITMLEGVKAVRSEKIKDEILIEGNDLDNVSQSAAKVHDCTMVRGKDIRKFLDGVYISAKENIV